MTEVSDRTTSEVVRRWLATTLCLGACLPAPATERARCAVDDECESNVCLADLTLGLSYCSNTCLTDQDCPAYQTCRSGSAQTSGGVEVGLCVDRVRACLTKELCNGLDDDCDGTIDGVGCEVIPRCLDDVPCGAFACRAFEHQLDLVCAPPNELNVVTDYANCQRDDQCRNGVCETGECAEMCRPVGGPDCPTDYLCAESFGLSTRPRHNLCQRQCSNRADCGAPTDCVFRPVFEGDPLRVFVCAPPPADRKALGAACQTHDECAHGLCIEKRCTRRCDGVGASCADVGSGTICKDFLLHDDLGMPLATAAICWSGNP